MNKYNFDQIVNRRNTDSIKYSDKQDNLLPMWVADMDFHVLDEIVEAAKQRADFGAYGYVDVKEDYFNSYINWFKRNHHLDIELDSCLFSCGVVASIDSIFKHILCKGAKVLMQTPIYHTFFHCVDNNEIELVENPLIYENYKYRIDWENLENLLKNVNINAFLLCNPHNPTGLSYSLDDINRIAKMCYENHVLLISDEIHGDIHESGYEYQSVLKCKEEYKDNVVALFSPSKAFNVASIHAAMVVVPNKELRERIQKGLWEDDVGEPNFFACPLTIAAYDNGDRWNQEMNEYIQKNKEYFSSFLDKNMPHVHMISSHFLYLVWVDISYYSQDSFQFSSLLKEQTGLQVSPGTQFKGNGSSFIRINLATSLDNVKDCCNRLLEFINRNISYS